MRRVGPRLAILLAALTTLVLGATGPAPPAAAQTLIPLDERVGETNGWRVGYSKAFAGCLAYTSFTDDTTVWIGFGAEIEFYIALSNPAWRSLEKGSKYRLTVRPRGTRNWNGEFLGVEGASEKGLIISGLKREFLVDFARAGSMQILMGDRQITQVSLTGSRNALNEMLDCQKERIERSRTDAKAAQGTPRRPQQKGASSGTGFFVSQDGHILTNQHVVEGCKTLDVSYVGGTPEAATVLATDQKNDLALVSTRMQPRAVPAFRSRVRVGESIFVYGFPLTGVLASSGNFTTGSITAVAGVGDDTSKLQISAPVQPGNSGGPLVDKRGNIVGVIVSRLKGDVAQNANFAIKSSIAETFLEVNNVQPVKVERIVDLDGADIADHAKTFTLHVVCNRAS